MTALSPERMRALRDNYEEELEKYQEENPWWVIEVEYKGYHKDREELETIYFSEDEAIDAMNKIYEDMKASEYTLNWYYIVKRRKTTHDKTGYNVYQERTLINPPKKVDAMSVSEIFAYIETFQDIVDNYDWGNNYHINKAKGKLKALKGSMMRNRKAKAEEGY